MEHCGIRRKTRSLKSRCTEWIYQSHGVWKGSLNKMSILLACFSVHRVIESKSKLPFLRLTQHPWSMTTRLLQLKRVLPGCTIVYIHLCQFFRSHIHCIWIYFQLPLNWHFKIFTAISQSGMIRIIFGDDERSVKHFMMRIPPPLS